MSKRASPAVIGAFVVGALALVVTGLIVFAGSKWFQRPVAVVMYFDESVNGLSVGAPVAFRGVRVGEVTAMRTEIGTGVARIAVFADLDRRQVLSGPRAGMSDRAAITDLVRRGARAQLALQSLLTGQLYVSVVIRPDTPVTLTNPESGLLEIPTVPTLLQQLSETLQKVPWDQVIQRAQQTLDRLNTLVQSPELERSLRSADALLLDSRQVMARLSKEIEETLTQLRQDLGPLIASLQATSDTTRATVSDAGAQLVQLRAQTADVLASLKDTSDQSRVAVQELARDLQQTLAQLQAQLAMLATKVGEASDTARVTLEKGQSVLSTAERTLDGQSSLGYQLTQTLQQLAATSRALRVLSDYLERHPEAVLSGKAPPGRD